MESISSPYYQKLYYDKIQGDKLKSDSDMKKSALKNIPIDQLVRGQYQPRSQFDEASLNELAESIRSAGLIQPLVVRPISTSQYEIIAGERRWRASAYAGLHTIPCLVRDITNEQAAAVTTIENIQREDLNPIEEAKAYQQLIQSFHYNHEEVAAIVGKSRTKITNSLRLLKLDTRVQKYLIDKSLSTGHGKVIAGLSEKYQYELAKKCVEQNWSVRRIEEEIRKISACEQSIQPSLDPDLARLERIVSDQIGSPTKLDYHPNKRGGWLKIRYFDYETLAGLLDKIGVDYE